MNAHDSERIRGLLEELGLGEAATPDEADVLVFNTCTIREKPDQRLAAHLGDANDAQGAQPGHRNRRRRLLRGGAARPDLRALSVHRRRVRPGHDPPPRRLAGRGRAGCRAFGLRHGRRAPLLRGARRPQRERRFQAWVQISMGCNSGVLLLHRARRPWQGGEPAAGRDTRRDLCARARGRPRGHAAGPERQLVGARSAARRSLRVRRAPARGGRGRRHRAHPLHEPTP